MAIFVREDEKLVSMSFFFMGIQVLLEMFLCCYTLLSNKYTNYCYVQQGARGPPGPKVGNK